MDRIELEVLLVEDNPADVLFLREALAQDTLAVFHLTVAESLAEALECLAGQTFSATLLDLGLPDSQGLPTFLKIYQAAPELPIVVLSALDDEDVARQALQAGAQDYLVKRPQEFPITGRAVRYAIERQRNRAALRASETNSRNIIETSESAFAILGRDGKILYTNPRGMGIWKDPQIVGKTIFDIYPQEYTEEYLRTICSVIDTQTNVKDEIESPIAGEKRWFEYTLTPFKNPDGTVSSALLNAWDLTERKCAEEKLQTSERMLKLFVEYAPASIAMFDRNMNYIAASRRYITDYRLPAENIIGRSHYQVFPETTERQKAIHRRCLAGVVEKNDGHPFLRADGTLDWVRWEIHPWYEASGEIGGLIFFSEVITERKQAEEKLRESETKYRELLNGMNDTIWVIDFDTTILDVNNAACTVLGYTREELLSKKISEIDLTLKPEQIQNLVSAMPQDRVQVFETQHTTRDGRQFPVEVSSSLVTYMGRTVIMSIARDITARKWAEETLRASEEKWRNLFEILPLGVSIVSPENNVVESNPALEKILDISDAGLSDGEHKSRRYFRSDNTLMPSEEFPSLRALREQKIIRDVEIGIEKENGARIWTSVSAAPLSAAGDTVTVTVDITERKLVEAALAESEKRLRLALETTSDGFWIVDSNRRFIDVNPAYCAMSGYTREEFLQLNISDVEVLESVEDTQAHIRKIEQDGRDRFETRHRRKDGSIFDVEVSVNVLDAASGLMICFCRDITARKEDEQVTLYRQELLEKVLQLGKSITAVTDLEQCLQEIYHGARFGLGFDRVGLFLYDPATRYAHGAYGTSRTGEIESPAFLDGSIDNQHDWKQALQHPKGLSFVEDYQKEYNPPEMHAMHGVGQHATVAAWSGEKPVALITVDNLLTGRKIKPADLEALQLFAGYAGLAIENARLHTGLEQKVQERTAEVRDLYNNAPTGYHSLDADGQIVMINQTELNWLGYTHAELIGQPFANLFTPNSLAAFRANFSHFKQCGWMRDLEFDLIRKDGSILPVLVSATAIRDEAGNYVMSRSTVFDNTERKKAETALRDSEERYRQLIELSPMAIVGFGNEARLELINHRAIEILGGTSPEDFVGKSIFEFVHPEYQANARERMRAASGSNMPAPAIETVYIKLNGQSLHVVSSGVAMSIQGKALNIVSFFDNSERKRAEEALRQSRDELSIAYAALEKASRAKDEFLANMSHELRTPLNGILGMSEILMDGIRGPLNERQRKMVEVIDSSGRHLLSLINDVLDLSKIEAEKLDLNLEKVQVEETCRACLSFIKEPAIKKGVKVDFVPDPGVITIRTDPRRLKQILVNLLSNAVKFTPAQGKVNLTIKAQPEQNCIEFSVSDTGIGIAPEDLQRLFQPFMQVDNSLTRRYEGTGLGLVLVKRLVELHGGTISVTSEVGRGSCFTVSLPWQPDLPFEVLSTPAVSAATVNPPVDSASKELATILLAEDNEANIMTIGDYLEIKGYKMVYARNGREAIEKASEVFPDLILMDVQMPEIDGLEVMRRLRADPRFAHLPMIALTALAMEGDRDLCLEAGATDYFSKPVSLKQLLASIQELLEQINE